MQSFHLLRNKVSISSFNYEVNNVYSLNKNEKKQRQWNKFSNTEMNNLIWI